MTPPGERNPQAVLTDYDVELIRELWDSEAPLREAEGGRRRPQHSTRIWTHQRLAETFGVSARHIRRLLAYSAR